MSGFVVEWSYFQAAPEESNYRDRAWSLDKVTFHCGHHEFNTDALYSAACNGINSSFSKGRVHTRKTLVISVSG
jgi:hypothetical protein